MVVRTRLNVTKYVRCLSCCACNFIAVQSAFKQASPLAARPSLFTLFPLFSECFHFVFGCLFTAFVIVYLLLLRSAFSCKELVLYNLSHFILYTRALAHTHTHTQTYIYIFWVIWNNLICNWTYVYISLFVLYFSLLCHSPHIPQTILLFSHSCSDSAPFIL